MEELKRDDLLFFRNEVLEDIKKLETNINEKITTLSKKLESYNLMNENKNRYHKEKLEEIIKKVDTTEFQNQIKDKMEKYKLKIDETIINSNVKIIKIEKDLANACYKYDKLFLKNMASPGLIGEGCPYPTMKSFFISLDKKIKELIASKEKAFSDFNSLKTYLDKTIEQFEKKIDKKFEENDQSITDKLDIHDKNIQKIITLLEDRFEYIRLENSKYIYSTIKNQELINEKLKLELKKYSLINETLIKYYNNQNKDINNNKDNNSKTIQNTKYKKRNSKKISLNLDEILPALKNIEDNFNFNINLYKNKDIKDLKIEDTHFEIRKRESFKKSVKEDKSGLLRRSIAQNMNYDSKLFYPIFNIYNDTNINKRFITNKNKHLSKKYVNIFKSEEKGTDLDIEEELNNSNNNLNTIPYKSIKSEEKKIIFEKISDDNLEYIQRRKSNLKEEIKEIKEIKEKNKKELKKKISLISISNRQIKKDKEKLISDKETITTINNDNINNYLNNNNNNIIKTIKEEKSDKTEDKIIQVETIKEKKEEETIENSKIEDENKKENKNIKNINNMSSSNNNNINIKFEVKPDDKYKNIENKFNEKINKIYKFIENNNEKENEKINEKIISINQQIKFLLNEINNFVKDKNKIKNNRFLHNNNSVTDNINLNNLYISSNSIMPLKLTDRSFRSSNKSKSINNYFDSKSNKKYNNRVINQSKKNNNTNNNNNYNDIDNYFLLLNKIEPYLIKKFKDP